MEIALMTRLLHACGIPLNIVDDLELGRQKKSGEEVCRREWRHFGLTRKARVSGMFSKLTLIACSC